MKREKGDNCGTFCIELWISLDSNNKTKSCHILKREDQLICQDFPSHGETHILNGLFNEYVKREVYFDLLTKLTKEALLIKNVIQDESGKNSLRDEIKKDVIAQINKNLSSASDTIIDSVLDDFINRTKLGR